MTVFSSHTWFLLKLYVVCIMLIFKVIRGIIAMSLLCYDGYS